MRPLRVAAVAAGCITVAVLASSLVALSRYAPLEQGSTSRVFAADMEQRASMEGEVTSFPYRDGGKVEIRQAVRNSGRLPVELDGIQWTKLGALDVVSTGPARHLNHGDEAEVVVQLRMGAPCAEMGAGTSIIVSDIPIRYRVLGRHRTQHVPLAEPFEVRFNDGAAGVGECTPDGGTTELRDSAPDRLLAF